MCIGFITIFRYRLETMCQPHFSKIQKQIVKNIFFFILDCFDALILKIILKNKKKLFLCISAQKNTLKNIHNHTLKLIPSHTLIGLKNKPFLFYLVGLFRIEQTKTKPNNKIHKQKLI